MSMASHDGKPAHDDSLLWTADLFPCVENDLEHQPSRRRIVYGIALSMDGPTRKRRSYIQLLRDAQVPQPRHSDDPWQRLDR